MQHRRDACCARCCYAALHGQGFLSPAIIDDFAFFADTCFRLFGDRVRRWLTFIEPLVICSQQYGAGSWAPGVNTGDAGRFQ